MVRPGDERLEELDEVMGWGTRINRVLDTNSLRIRCQQIIPVPANTGEQLHFETLLTVVDERGEHIPPTEFIKVAAAIHTAVSDIGVDYAQGHLFGQPVTLDQPAQPLSAHQS